MTQRKNQEMAERIKGLEYLIKIQSFELLAAAKRQEDASDMISNETAKHDRQLEEIQSWRIRCEDHLREWECGFDTHDESISEFRKEKDATASCLSALQSRVLIQSQQIERLESDSGSQKVIEAVLSELSGEYISSLGKLGTWRSNQESQLRGLSQK